MGTALLLDEAPLLAIPDAACQVTGRAITTRTALRWSIAGLRGIRLETIKVAGRRLTTLPAMRRFVERTQELPEPHFEPSKAAVAARTETVLEQFGLGRGHC